MYFFFHSRVNKIGFWKTTDVSFLLFPVLLYFLYISWHVQDLTLLPPVLLCYVHDWCQLMLQNVKEVKSLNGHHVCNWLEVLVSFIGRADGNAISSFGTCTFCGSASQTESSKKDSLKWTLPALLNWRDCKSCTVRFSSFFAWRDANEIRSIPFVELITIEQLHIVRWWPDSCCLEYDDIVSRGENI